ncbi:MAG: T9SS type A sorting domain-containing protein, partial [Bacteroidia bacterium]|nr:T9SS type A sorting domain-containing protein [Bacteroidia bacterium]
NHPDNSKSYLYTECYNLSNISSPVLKFNMAYQIEQNWDLLYVEYSIDEGNSWLLLGEESPNWYNSSRIAGDGIANDCYNCVGGQWTGVNTTISNYQYNLNDFTNESSIIFRFIFHADYAVNFEGAVIDDLVVEGTLSNAEHATNSFIVYPNPSNNIFNIKFATPTDFNFNIIDITGKTILSRKDIDNSQNHFQLNMSNFAPGIYFLKIESNSVYKNKKIILK